MPSWIIIKMHQYFVHIQEICMDLPNYWQTEKNIPYFKIGNTISAISAIAYLHLDKATVVYSVYTENARHDRERMFKTADSARQFAIAWGHYMHKCEAEKMFPLPWTFEKF